MGCSFGLGSSWQMLAQDDGRATCEPVFSLLFGECTYVLMGGDSGLRGAGDTSRSLYRRHVDPSNRGYTNTAQGTEGSA